MIALAMTAMSAIVTYLIRYGERRGDDGTPSPLPLTTDRAIRYYLPSSAFATKGSYPVRLLESEERHLRWDSCLNVRDLGGYPTADAGETRWRAIVRADTLGRLTPVGSDALLAYGVRTVIDLRHAAERARDP